MTLKFSGFAALVKGHVPAKFHQAECSFSWVTVLKEKKTLTKTIQSVTTARTVIIMSIDLTISIYIATVPSFYS